ncbi:hypothetical protein [Corynebacterium occultum]|uniref:hypothetical protein n=1 Tax=Corynebacterium occultum TaxID=2675219 RepID=UPI0012E100D0|nr:hypothetical protein [Corynebacterium occultum]
MDILKMIDSLDEKAEQRWRRAPAYRKEFVASREVIDEHSDLSREEIDKVLADQGLPSLTKGGKAMVKTLVVFTPLILARAALANVRKLIVRLQGRKQR